MAIYFFYGDEDFNIEKEIGKLKSGLDKNFLEMSFKTYDNPKFPDLVSILRSQPMMFGKMLVVINCLDYFTKTFDDKQLKEIESALENNNENLDIVFVASLPRDGGKKLDSRKKLFKMLSKHNAKECASIPGYKTAELEDWVKKSAKSKSLKINPDAVTALMREDFRYADLLWISDFEMEPLSPVWVQYVDELKQRGMRLYAVSFGRRAEQSYLDLADRVWKVASVD